MRILFLYALAVCAYGQQPEDFDQQQVQQFAQSVKGGHGGWQPYNPSSGDLVKIFENRNPSDHSHNMRPNLTTGSGQIDLDIGVCYIEVPTASLVKSGVQVPAGNGSQPNLSRIRSCCKGYIRNIHNFKRCDPVCEPDCVNALCTAPNTCTCFPDHVKNLAGFCIPTCPIGCQNGNCAGGECLCKDGFKLDADSKYCTPTCKENCGGIGNCTAPNTCNCKSGFESTPEGSCRPHCDKCSNGDCIAPNDCRCHQGFAKDQQGLCVLQCQAGYQATPEGCKPVCDRCTNGDCIGPNNCHCHQGYAKDQQGLCVPQCTPACLSTSRCVSPNVCDPPTPVQPNQPNPNQPSQPNQPNPNQPNQPNPNQPYQPNQSNPNQPNPNQPYQPNQPYPYPDQSVLPIPDGVPQCSQPCLNGYCIGGNRCSCNSGYVPDKTNPNMCVPHCSGGCVNGVCSAPNFCICNAGYFKDHSVKGRPSCVKRSKRSAEEPKPLTVPKLLGYKIPDEGFY